MPSCHGNCDSVCTSLCPTNWSGHCPIACNSNQTLFQDSPMNLPLKIRAGHISINTIVKGLQQAINAERLRRKKTAFPFSTVIEGVPVKPIHIYELRSALHDIYEVPGCAAAGDPGRTWWDCYNYTNPNCACLWEYVDPTCTQHSDKYFQSGLELKKVEKKYIEDLRNRIHNLENDCIGYCPTYKIGHQIGHYTSYQTAYDIGHCPGYNTTKNPSHPITIGQTGDNGKCSANPTGHQTAVPFQVGD